MEFGNINGPIGFKSGLSGASDFPFPVTVNAASHDSPWPGSSAENSVLVLIFKNRKRLGENWPSTIISPFFHAMGMTMGKPFTGSTIVS